MRKLLSALLAAGVFGCAESPTYVYAPDTANATLSGLPAARTAIPQEAPQGAIEVASYGVTELRPGNTPVRALHVREIVTNDGDDAPWQLDTSQQLVEIPGEGTSRALYVNADTQTLPIVSIARHQRRVLDFYFPLPDTIRQDARLPQFEVLWQVATPARTVASRTSFDRVTEEPETVYAYDGVWPYWAGFGPYWWFDAGYPRFAFRHAHPVVIRDHRGPIAVGRFGGGFRAGGAHVAAHHR